MNTRAATRLHGSIPYGPRSLVFLGLSLSLLLPILFAVLLWFDLNRENDASAERAEVVAQSVQRQFGERLERLTRALRGIAETAASAEKSSAVAVPPEAATRSPIDARLMILGGIVLVHAGHTTDMQGRLVDAGWLPQADPDARPAGLSIGKPVRFAPNQHWVIPVAWDGLPNWRVGARIDADWFAQTLADYRLGEGGMLNLMHRDRMLLARSTENQRYVGTRVERSPLFFAPLRDQASGRFVEPSALDGVERQFVFQRIPHSPVIVIVGVARRHILALWWRFAVIGFSTALLLAALWFWLSRAFERSHARQAQLLAELREQSQRGDEARRIAKLGDWSWNVETGDVIWSPEIYAICGLPPRESSFQIGDIAERMHPDDRERVNNYIARAMEDEELDETQYRIVRPDGEVRWVYARAEWVDRRPGHRMLRGIQQDITELAEARERLSEAQEQYRFLFEHNPLPMCVYDRHTLQILAANDAMAQHYGYTRDELLAVNMIDIRPPEEVASTRALLLGPADNYPQGRIWTHSHKSGERMRMMAFGHEIDFDAHPARLIVLHDVTERERHEQRFQLVARATSDTIWDWDLQTDTTWRSDNAFALFGFKRDEIGSTLHAVDTVLHPDDRARITDSLERVIASDANEWEDTYRLLRKDGSYAEILDRALLLRDAHGRALRMIGGMLDVTQKHLNEAELRLFRRAVESADNGILIADARIPGMPAVYVNHAFEKMSGYAAEDIIGTRCRFLEEGDTDETGCAAIRKAIGEQRDIRVLLRDRRKDGESFWNDFHLAPVRDAGGELTHYVSIQSDVSERELILEQLAYRATYDELTGLPNRQLLFDRLQQSIRNADLAGRGIGVLFVDLDEFKLINDSMGHSAGDDVLRTVGKRFEKAVRSPDTLGRFGGDEFVVILTEQIDEGGVGRVIERINAALAEPVDIAGALHYLTASIGYCRYPDAGMDAETLLKKADLAMYQAKQQGRNRAVAYHADFDADINERLHLVSALRDALQRDEFRLVFQPLFSRNGAAVGLEALLRWQRPERGLIMPEQFIGVCEDSGLIVLIGRWVLNEAARRYAQLSAAGLGHLRIAVNVSAAQFQQNLYEDVRSAIEAHALPKGVLELELTESVIMVAPETAIATMRRLDALGVSIAVDDFGTGYSSLAYLKRLPIDRLKIDRSFVSDLGRNADDEAICAAIIQLARSLGLRTVAEGVETAQQLGWLHARGCDEVQGFLLGRPLPFDEALQALLDAHTPRSPDAAA